MARGKYAAVIDRLPRMLGTEPQYQDKVEAVKAAMAAEPGFLRHASHLAHAYAELRAERDAIESELSECNLRLEAVSQMMAEQFEVEGTTSLRLASGQQVGVYWEPYAQVADRELFRQWCLADPDLARKMMLHPQTTNMLAKERLLAGDPEPPGVTIYARPKVRLLGSE